MINLVVAAAVVLAARMKVGSDSAAQQRLENSLIEASRRSRGERLLLAVSFARPSDVLRWDDAAAHHASARRIRHG